MLNIKSIILILSLFIILKFVFHFNEQIMYNVYLISISYIYLPYFILLYMWALYESTPDYSPIHHVMHVEYGNTVLLLLLYFPCKS